MASVVASPLSHAAEPIRPSKILYIKLGAGGSWEQSSFDNGRIEWGLDCDPHDLPSDGRWDALRQHYIASGFSPATATSYVREARSFYDPAPDILWITFARGHLWWAFAEPRVELLGPASLTQGSRYRQTVSGWQCTNIKGEPLRVDGLSTRMTRLAGYPRTLCAVKEADLCLRYINAEADAVALAVQQAQDALVLGIERLIQRLSWSDFELLTDLILTRSGWRRISALGGMMKDVDLVVEQPLTGKRMAAQVKSAMNRHTLADYHNRLITSGAAETLLIVCHSPEADVVTAAAAYGDTMQLLTGNALARLTIDCGLIQWTVERAK